MAGEPSTPTTPVAASTPPGSHKTTERPKSKLFETVKRVFTIKKKEKEGKSKASASTTEAKPVPAADAAATTESSKPQPAAPEPAPVIESTKTEAKAAVKAIEKAVKPTRTTRRPPGPPPPVLTPAERAQALFKKHGLDIVPTQWPLSNAPRAERVHKEIRMRVHRTCHRCDTAYGADPTCISCGHRRCKQCPRFPLKKEKGKEKAGDKRDPLPVRRRKPELGDELTMPSKTGGQDLVRRKIRQRVHRTCHRCKREFGAEKICECGHHRCKTCPRDPLKKNKPPGYYNDPSDSECEQVHHGRPARTYKKITRRVHWTCSKCSQTFKGTKICEGCGSNRDDTGIREPAKKSKNPNAAVPSESYMENLEERLMATTIA